MKKCLLAASITFLGMTPFVNVTEVHAKEYPLSENFVQNLKKDKFPRSKGAIGMSYKTFEKKIGKSVSIKYGYEDKSVVTSLNGPDSYLFSSSNKKKAKIVRIERTYNYVIKDSSFQKYFGNKYKGIGEYNGKVYATNIRKANKAYVIYDYRYLNLEKSFLTLGTRKQMLDYHTLIFRSIYR